MEAADIAASLPRNETLYFNGQQWGSVVGWNPYSNSNNNAMAIGQQDSARVIMFETPYLYNMLDGQVYPLLADGPYEWNDDRTEITFKLNPAAHWSDGTPVTAEDVAYTWATHVKYNTPTGAANVDYIEDIVAVDPQTVVVKAKLDADGNAVNPLIVAAYMSSNYVIQKAWTETLEERTGGDATELMADPAEDVVYSGPYHKFFADDSKVVYVRDDNYWGQDASMWGKLPVPKYLAHTIFKDNAAGSVALQVGEVDVSQQFNSNIQDLWLENLLPISTYLPEAPYGIGASLPTAFYNLNSPGLDQVAVRKAIAIAVDYPTIIANAMTDQSATFDQVPRSLMNPTPGEQALYDHDCRRGPAVGRQRHRRRQGAARRSRRLWIPMVMVGVNIMARSSATSPPAPTAGPTGRPPLKWWLPPAPRSALKSRRTSPNGPCTRPWSPNPTPPCPKGMTSS